MKKAILFVMLLSLSFYGFSQGTKYGVRAGYNISNLDFKDTPLQGNDHRNGFAIGFFGEFGLSKGVAIQPEIQFSSEGADPEELQLDYIQVPALFKFRLGEKFHLLAGPQAGVKVHKASDGIDTFAFSGVGGIEFKISHTLFADVRYTYGFSDIFDDLISVEAKNTNLQLAVGYKF